MQWSEYYERFDNWEESAQYSWLKAITDFGPDTSPSFQIADCVQNVDDRTANKIIKLAMTAGVRFSCDEVLEILEGTFLDDDVICALVKFTDESAYSAAMLERLLNALSDETPALDLIDRICQKSNHFADTELVPLIEALCDEERSGKLLLTNTTKFSEETMAALCDAWVDEEVIRAVARRSGIPYSDLCEDEEESEDDFVDMSYDEPKQGGGVGLLGALIAGVAAFGNSGNHKKHNGRCNGDCANCPPHYGYRYGRWYYGHGHMHGCEFGGNRRGGGD
jgi:hypothetical protein